MKKFNTNRLRAFFMALLLVLTSTSTTNVLYLSELFNHRKTDKG